MERLVVGVLILAAAVLAQHQKYEGHQLYRVAGPSEEIRHLEAKIDILSATSSSRSTSGHLEAVVRLSPQEKDQWLTYFEGKNIKYTKIADNLAEILRDERSKVDKSRAAAKLGRDEGSSEGINFDTYLTFQEINDYLDDLAARFPNLVTVINAALSYEGRQIKYVRISTSGFEDPLKPVIIIDACIHAREWVTPPVALYIIDRLVDEVNRELVNLIDWVIIPMLNPDGYEYTWTDDRLWRKTRSLNHPGSFDCPGVDGNRNYDHVWGTSPDSSDPCSIIYEGPAPFSEAETRLVRDVVTQHLARAELYISLHSYGSMFLYAWGNNGTLPSNGINLHLAGITMAQAIDANKLPEAQSYIVGNAANVLYYTTGTSRDWTRAVGIPLTYTLELPGYDYGFLVPPDYMRQIVTETWVGMAAGARYVIDQYQIPS